MAKVHFVDFKTGSYESVDLVDDLKAEDAKRLGSFCLKTALHNKPLVSLLEDTGELPDEMEKQMDAAKKLEDELEALARLYEKRVHESVREEASSIRRRP